MTSSDATRAGLRGIEIHRLSRSMAAERSTVARLHFHYLPLSDLNVLGMELLYAFSYGALLDDPRYYCYVATIDGEIAGFQSSSSDAGAVLRSGLSRFWPTVVRLTVLACVARPAKVPKVLRALRAFMSLQTEPHAEVRAEALSTVVEPRYRTVEFYRRTNMNVARELYLATARGLAADGVRIVKTVSRKSDHHVHASISSLGWRKVFEGPLRRAVGGSVACIWLWDLHDAVRSNEPARGEGTQRSTGG